MRSCCRAVVTTIASPRVLRNARRRSWKPRDHAPVAHDRRRIGVGRFPRDQGVCSYRSAPRRLTFLWPYHMALAFFLWAHQRGRMTKEKLDLLQGTLDLLVLRTLESIGPLHGYGIARRIEQVGGDLLQLNQGTIYAALVRLQQGKLIEAEWGASENNRRAKFYSLTAHGRKRLAVETETWNRLSNVVHRILTTDGAAPSP